MVSAPVNSYGSDMEAVAEFSQSLLESGPTKGDKKAGGWSSIWERLDGAPCLVAADTPSRDTVDAKGYTDHSKLFGYFPMYPLFHNGKLAQRPRSKVEILQSFQRDPNPERREVATRLLAALYAPVKREAARVYPCAACGLALGTVFALEMHALSCTAAQQASDTGAQAPAEVPTPPVSADAPVPEAVAIPPAPPKVYQCVQCALPFTSPGKLGGHVAVMHPKKKRTARARA